jgi:hypothetical protein
VTYIDDLAGRVEDAIPAELRPREDAQRLYRLYALLVLIKGPDVTAEDVHDAWAVWMTERHSDHRSLVPFAELDQRIQESDQPFVDSIRQVARYG